MNFILKVIVIVIDFTFCQTQYLLPDTSLHRQISLSPDWLLNQIVIYNIIDSVGEKPLHLKQTKHCVLNRIQVDYHGLPIIPQLRIYILHH